MKRAPIFIGLLLAALAIAGCSNDKALREGPLAISDDQLGPDTKELVKTLPGGLVADTANARYSSQPLRGEDEDDGDGAP